MLPERLLIANRGEIAVRIAVTCRQLGITSVGIFAESDAHALFVRSVDLAVPIGGVTAPESYLRADLVIGAALEAGANALHPGYGFLSERADFAEACGAAGVTFIGPTAAAMNLVGNKVAALRLAGECGIPTIAGYQGPDQSTSRLAEEGERIGFPLMVKAASGGGGRGMRVVERGADLRLALEAARREATAAFGEGTVFLERLLRAPRHVEVQIIADTHGNVLILGDRDCSVQRRHQKLIEEAPAPGLDTERRAALHDAARRLVAAAGYTNAGTVEFLIDDTGYYFLEMNARLQVEHPVTEQVIGVDLVALQIRVAAGEALTPLGIATVPWGHAVEARLNAEDPERGFLPAAGVVDRCDFPRMPGLRVDSGLESGDAVNPHFDSLLAKLIAEGPTRAIAIRRLDVALTRTVIHGVTTNRAFLLGILRDPVFLEARHTTADLAEHEQALIPQRASPDHGCWLAAAIGTVLEESPPMPGATGAPAPLAIWGRAFGAWRHGAARRSITLACAGETSTVRLWQDAAGAWHDAESAYVATVRAGDAWQCDLAAGAVRRRLKIARRGLEVRVEAEGAAYDFVIAPAPSSLAGRAATGEAAGSILSAPMPGLIVKQFVDIGDSVQAGQPLLALEAMKMEHIVVAPHAGVVTQLPGGAGAQVLAGAVLAVVEPREGARGDQ